MPNDRGDMNIKLVLKMIAIILLSVLSGCVNSSSSSKRTEDHIELTLVPIGNVNDVYSWPPAIFVERGDGTGIELNERLTGLKYVPGSAILLVQNLSAQEQSVANWDHQSWKIIIEEEGGTRKESQLFGSKPYLPSVGPSSRNVLESGEIAAVVVGVSCFLPENRIKKEGQAKATNIYVTYESHKKSMKSNCLNMYRYSKNR